MRPVHASRAFLLSWPKGKGMMERRQADSEDEHAHPVQMQCLMEADGSKSCIDGHAFLGQEEFWQMLLRHLPCQCAVSSRQARETIRFGMQAAHSS